MKNSREKFEEWLSNYELQPNARLGEEELDLMLDAWQAATEQSQKEIAELKAREKALVEALIEAIGYISPYTVNDSVVNRWKALATVRGE